MMAQVNLRGELIKVSNLKGWSFADKVGFVKDEKKWSRYGAKLRI